MDLRLDLYLPVPATRPLPVLLFIHGGGWSRGSKAICPLESFILSGFAGICINYRKSGEAPFPAQILDVKEAVRWLRRNANRLGLDPDRVAVWGMSAGGHLAALLGTAGEGVPSLDAPPDDQVSAAVQAVIDWYGPTDFRRVDFARYPEYAEAAAGLVPGFDPASHTGGGELVDLANPARHASADDPPFLIMHGQRDPVVPWEQSQILHEALVKAGARSTLRLLPEAGHGDGFGPEQFQEMLAFLHSVVGAPPLSEPGP